ncbi:MAG: hypothetical protein ABR599_13175 [Gemmatimonadota bacterium]
MTTRPVTILALLAAAASVGAGAPEAAAQVRWDNDVRLSYEYDDNVEEEVSNPAGGQVARVSLRSDLIFADSTNQLSAVYQGGYKRYFEVSTTDLERAGQFINEGELRYQRLLGSATQMRVFGGLKDRSWQDEDVFFVNEDGFTSLWGGAGARQALGGATAAELTLRVSGIEFDHVDEVFGYDAQSATAGVVQRFGGGELGGVLGDVSYGLEQRTYDGRAKLRGPDDDPSNIFAPDRPRQIDLSQDVGLGISFLQPFGFQGRYRFRYNRSNSFGFDYYSHIVSLQLAQQLPWRMIVQFYGNVELRKFKEEVRGLVGALDVEDTDNNVLLFRLLKELNGHVDVEARYGRYRNESINLNDFYTKNVYSLGFRFRP